jgi:hypothetical protein
MKRKRCTEEQIAFALRQSRPASLLVPPLTWRLVNWQRISRRPDQRYSGLNCARRLIVLPTTMKTPFPAQ